MHLASHAWAPRVICLFVPRGVAAALALLRVDGARSPRARSESDEKKGTKLRVVHITYRGGRAGTCIKWVHKHSLGERYRPSPRNLGVGSSGHSTRKRGSQLAWPMC